MDARGIDYKLLFQLPDYSHDLTSAAFTAFSARLAQLGYHGDAKTPLYPGWARFQYNTLIVHAASRADAAIAEAVVKDIFGAKVTAYSRGADVKDASTGGRALDWHDYLCSVHADLSNLPADVQAFIAFAEQP
jgi:hypothetical protein